MSKDKFIELLNENTQAVIDWYEKAKTQGVTNLEDLQKIWDSRDKLIEYHTGRDKTGKFVSKNSPDEAQGEL